MTRPVRARGWSAAGGALREFRAVRRRAAALPDNGWSYRPSGRALPNDGRLALVGDPRGDNLGSRHARAIQQQSRSIKLRIQFGYRSDASALRGRPTGDSERASGGAWYDRPGRPVRLRSQSCPLGQPGPLGPEVRRWSTLLPASPRCRPSPSSWQVCVADFLTRAIWLPRTSHTPGRLGSATMVPAAAEAVSVLPSPQATAGAEIGSRRWGWRL